MNKQAKKENSVKEKVVESKELSIDELLILGEKENRFKVVRDTNTNPKDDDND